MTEGCLFCRIAAGVVPTTVVGEDDQVLAFRDIDPKAPTHVLVIPRRHIASVSDLTAADHDLVGRLFTLANAVASAEGVAQSGYRLVMNSGQDAGQSVAHIHLHVLGGRRMRWPPG